jgi:hypothetical protein
MNRTESGGKETVDLGRRRLLKTAAVGGLALGTGIGIAAWRECQVGDRIQELLYGPTEANAFLDKFPDETQLSTVAHISKYRTPGAKHCLVHIRQIHDLPGGKMGQDGIDSQNEIEMLLTQMMDNKSIALKEAYEEGETESTLTSQEALDNMELSVHRSNVLVLQHQLDTIEETIRSFPPEKAARYQEELKMLRQKIREAEQKDIETNVAKLCATGRLKKKRGLRVLAAEETKENIEGVVSVLRAAQERRAPTRQEQRAMFDEREKVLLQRVTDSKKAWAVSTYGALHDFRYSIEAWNREHPDHSFSLIELTPKSVARVMERDHGRAWPQ